MASFLEELRMARQMAGAKHKNHIQKAASQSPLSSASTDSNTTNGNVHKILILCVALN